MVLAKPLVIEDRGRVTLMAPAEQALTEASLERMAAQRAEYACIRVDEDDDPAGPERRHAAAEARLRRIFRGADLTAPASRALFDALLKYRSL